VSGDRGNDIDSTSDEKEKCRLNRILAEFTRAAGKQQHRRRLDRQQMYEEHVGVAR
jgi:hypothetical protein